MPIKQTRPAATKVPGILKDGPNRYIVRARWTDPKTGRRRKREGIAKTLKAAVLLQQRLKGSIAPTKPTRQRFSDYAERWITQHASELAPSTRERYLREIAHAVVVLGSHYVDAIEEDDIRAWRKVAQHRWANTTVNAAHRTLRVVLDPLVRDGVLRRNPARDVSTLREKRTGGARGTSLKADQLARFISTTEELAATGIIESDVGRMLITLAWTGLRKGELLALKWIDVEEDELVITRSVCKVTRTEKETKTDDPRLVPIPAPLRKVLDAQRRWLIETQHAGLESGLVFPADESHARTGMRRRALDAPCWYRSDSVLDRPIRRIVTEAGVPRVTPHSFRRTYENLLRRAGVDDLVRRSMAGWRTNKAQEIYAGVDREERAEGSRRMVELVKSNGKVP